MAMVVDHLEAPVSARVSRTGFASRQFAIVHQKKSLGGAGKRNLWRSTASDIVLRPDRSARIGRTASQWKGTWGGAGYAARLCDSPARTMPSAMQRLAGTGFTTGTPARAEISRVMSWNAMLMQPSISVSAPSSSTARRPASAIRSMVLLRSRARSATERPTPRVEA